MGLSWLNFMTSVVAPVFVSVMTLRIVSMVRLRVIVFQIVFVVHKKVLHCFLFEGFNSEIFFFTNEHLRVRILNGVKNVMLLFVASPFLIILK